MFLTNYGLYVLMCMHNGWNTHVNGLKTLCDVFGGSMLSVVPRVKKWDN